MTDPVEVDVNHIRRCGRQIGDYGRDISKLADDLQARTAVGPRWSDGNGGAVFTAVLDESTEATLSKLRVLAQNIENMGAKLEVTAAEFEASEERAAAEMRKLGRGL